MGWVVLAVAIGSGLVGLTGAALYELDAISSDTAADLGLVSLGGALAAVAAGFPLRRRVRLARDGMFVGLATLGAWFLLLVFALSQG
jgi:hypothetical protein